MILVSVWRGRQGCVTSYSLGVPAFLITFMATVLGPQEMLQSPTGTWGSVQYPNDYTGGPGQEQDVTSP